MKSLHLLLVIAACYVVPATRAQLVTGSQFDLFSFGARVPHGAATSTEFTQGVATFGSLAPASPPPPVVTDWSFSDQANYLELPVNPAFSLFYVNEQGNAVASAWGVATLNDGKVNFGAIGQVFNGRAPSGDFTGAYLAVGVQRVPLQVEPPFLQIQVLQGANLTAVGGTPPFVWERRRLPDNVVIPNSQEGGTLITIDTRTVRLTAGTVAGNGRIIVRDSDVPQMSYTGLVEVVANNPDPDPALQVVPVGHTRSGFIYAGFAPFNAAPATGVTPVYTGDLPNGNVNRPPQNAGANEYGLLEINNKHYGYTAFFPGTNLVYDITNFGGIAGSARLEFINVANPPVPDADYRIVQVDREVTGTIRNGVPPFRIVLTAQFPNNGRPLGVLQLRDDGTYRYRAYLPGNIVFQIANTPGYEPSPVFMEFSNRVRLPF